MNILEKIIIPEQDCLYSVVSLLGPSIEDLFNLCGRRFSLKTTLMIFDQMIDRLNVLHSKGIAHGNITPSKIMMGLADQS